MDQPVFNPHVNYNKLPVHYLVRHMIVGRAVRARKIIESATVPPRHKSVASPIVPDDVKDQ